MKIHRVLNKVLPSKWVIILDPYCIGGYLCPFQLSNILVDNAVKTYVSLEGSVLYKKTFTYLKYLI